MDKNNEIEIEAPIKKLQKPFHSKFESGATENFAESMVVGPQINKMNVSFPKPKMENI